MLHRALRGVATLLALVPLSLHAQARPTAGVDPVLFEGLRYRLIGPSRGGRVTAVTGVPSQPKTYYMGAASGGVFKTTDGGESWLPVTDGQVPVGSVGALVVADSDPNVVYLGTGSDGLRSNVSTGRGVYRSPDAGKTWAFAGLYDVGQIGGVRVHPRDPNTVWVAANGDAFKPSPARGIYKSRDGGKNWQRTLFVSDSSGAMDVELHPSNPDVVYAWMSRIERKPWTIISGAREGGFYRSTDGGVTWTKVTTGLPSDLIGKGNIAVTAANPNRVYALIEAKPGGGLYRSDDAGLTWTLMNSQSSLLQRPFYYVTLGADPTNADAVYAGAEGFFKSMDGGKTMTSMRTPHGDNHDIWINPTNGQTMIQANDGGANVSFDGGRTWSTQLNQPTAEIYGVWLDNEFPYNLFGAQQDNTTMRLSSQSVPGPREDLGNTPGCETGPVIPHPTDPNVIYGSCKGQYSVMNLRTGQSRNYWIGGQSLYGNPASDLIWRMQRVSPMALSPHDPTVLYYGSQYLHRTRDLGVTWETLSPDLTAKPACCQGVSGEPITRDVTGEEFYSTLYAISESPLEAGVIWTGANDGPIHVTRDGGKSWTNVTPKDLPAGGRVQWIEASPHTKGTAYAAVYRYLLGDYAPYFYRTKDYGRTWTRIVTGIRADEPTRVLRADPDRPGLLYGGTEFGMYISFDDGAQWQPFQLNLPNVPITDIKVHRKDLIVATQGRAFWIIDNLSALHQLASTTKSDSVILFTPRDGYKTRTNADKLGPMIEYRLPATVAAVQVEILDSTGKRVNSYVSAPASATPAATPRPAAAANVDPDDPDAAMMAGRGGRGGAGTASRPTTTAGLNRFTWDARTSDGLGAPPGRYTVRLTVGDQVRSAPLRLRIDPRIAADGTTEADLVAQYRHNLQMRGMVTEVTQLVAKVRAAETRLKAAGPAATDTLTAVQALAATLNTEPVRYGKPGLQAHISYLAGMTGGADQKVGRDAIERAKVLRKELDAVLAEAKRWVP
jgi:photosystem II stability/assembly factor-like uncharacterized protein